MYYLFDKVLKIITILVLGFFFFVQMISFNF